MNLFGGNNPPAGGNLFAGGANKPAGNTPATGGLFGNTGANNAPATGGLFAGNAPTTGGNLLGNNPPAGGNLFAGGANKPANAPIFGGATNTTNTGGATTTTAGNNAPTSGLFGGNTTNQPTVNTATNPTNTTTTGGGIFGGNQNTTTNPISGNVTGPQANTITPNANTNTATGQNKPTQQLANPANDVSLANEKLNPLVQKWKRKIQSQSEHLLQTYTSLGESITQIEQCHKYYENIATISQGLNGQFEQINIEVKNIEQYQTQIEQHLDIIRSKLTKQLELQGDSEANAFKNPIGEKIQGIDFGLSQIEKNVNQLIDEINPQKDQSQDGKKTIQQCLNSYYQILEKLEYDTINLQFKLQSVSEKVADQY